MDSSLASGILLTLLAMVLYGGLHSLLATDWAKGQALRVVGPLADRWYRLAYNVIGGLTFLPVVAVPLLYPGETLIRLQFPWILFSSAIQLMAVLLLLVSLLQTDVLRFVGFRQLVQAQMPPSEMVVRGPYRWVRHPLYTAGLLFIWATPVMTTTLLAFNLGITAYLYIGSIFEERKLLVQWGDVYREYQRQVPRLIPLPWRRFRGPAA